jgi:Ca2+-binding RTX toxin-like protein
MLRFCTLFAVFLAGLVGAESAPAGTVSFVDYTLRYEAAPGESNHVTIKMQEPPLAWTFTETGAPLTPGPGCSVDGQTASCPMPGIDPLFLEIHVALADGDDFVSAKEACLDSLDPNLECFVYGIDGGTGDDTLIGDDRGGQIWGREGDDVILGGSLLEGGAGDDLLLEGAGDDLNFLDSWLDGGPGADTLIGGGSSARVVYRDGVRPVFVSLNGRRDDGERGENDNVIGVRDVVTGSGDDVIVGDVQNNELDAGAGHDVVYAGGGNDLVFGGSCGAFGPDGDDRLYGQSGNDSLQDCDGRDAIYGGLGRDYLFGGDGADRLFGIDQADTIFGGLGGDTIVGGRGEDVLRGQEGNDMFYARDRQADRIVGWTGTDRARIDRGLDRRSSIERLF